MSKECNRCGFEIEENDVFCGGCGLNLLSKSSTPGLTSQGIDVVDIQINLGIVYFKKKEFDRALTLFKEVLKIRPDHETARRFAELSIKALNAMP